MSEKILKEILSKVTSIEGELKEFKQEVNERFNKVDEQLKDLDNRTLMLLSDNEKFREEVNKKLDRQTAKLDRVSTAIKEHDLRLEDLKDKTPV